MYLKDLGSVPSALWVRDAHNLGIACKALFRELSGSHRDASIEQEIRIYCQFDIEKQK